MKTTPFVMDRSVERPLSASEMELRLLGHIQSTDRAARCAREVSLMRGDCFADVLAVSPSCLHGYEVKSDTDDLRRLGSQVPAYSRVMDRCSLVITAKWVRQVVRPGLLPTWWGVMVVTRSSMVDMQLDVIRPAEDTPTPDAVGMASLLWRDEARGILLRLGHGKGTSCASRAKLYARLAERVPMPELRQHIRDALVARPLWRRDTRAS